MPPPLQLFLPRKVKPHNVGRNLKPRIASSPLEQLTLFSVALARLIFTRTSILLRLQKNTVVRFFVKNWHANGGAYGWVLSLLESGNVSVLFSAAGFQAFGFDAVPVVRDVLGVHEAGEVVRPYFFDELVGDGWVGESW